MFIFQIIAVVLIIDGVFGSREYHFSCQNEKVLAFVKQNTSEIDLNQADLLVCGEKRGCTYSKGPSCVGKGNYASGVSEVDGKITMLCCMVTPSVQDHQQDDCSTTLHIETDDHGKVSVAASPIGLKPPPGRAAGAAQPSQPQKQEVTMQGKTLPPSASGQYVKSITKIEKNGIQGYTVTLCTPQCGRSTTTKRPTTQTPPTQKPEEKKQEAPHPKKGLFGGGHHCFSGDMTVETPSGLKRMDELHAGDRVKVDNSNYEPIEWFYHRDPRVQVDFISITTQSGRTVKLSANHLIPVIPCNLRNLTSTNLDQLINTGSRFAHRVKPGECLASFDQDQFDADGVISMKKEHQQGIYSPITSSGTLVVNGVMGSCFSSVENHLAQKTVHSLLIKARRVFNSFISGNLALFEEDSEIPTSLKFMLKIAGLAVPSGTVFSL